MRTDKRTHGNARATHTAESNRHRARDAGRPPPQRINHRVGRAHECTSEQFHRIVRAREKCSAVPAGSAGQYFFVWHSIAASSEHMLRNWSIARVERRRNGYALGVLVRSRRRQLCVCVCAMNADR